MGIPHSWTVPVVAWSRVVNMRINVDLPAPFLPSKPNIPAEIVSDTSFNAGLDWPR
jgi:hypothetical protein